MKRFFSKLLVSVLGLSLVIGSIIISPTKTIAQQSEQLQVPTTVTQSIYEPVDNENDIPEIADLLPSNLIKVSSEDSTNVKITGPTIIKKNSEIIFQVHLHDIPENVTAGKFEIEYPPALLEYINVSVTNDHTEIISSQHSSGLLTVITTSFLGGFINNESIIELKFLSKSNAGSNLITVEAELGIGDLGNFLTDKYSALNIEVRAPIEGDINSNFMTDIGDLAAMAYYFNIDPLDPSWSFVSTSDFNRNEIIDLEDLVFLAKKLITESSSFNIMEASVSSIHQAVKSGEITFVELIQLYLDRIKAYDKQGPNINSIITINPEALTLAAELDAEYAATGELKPLHGIPVIVKDNYDTIGMPTSAGCICLQDHYTATDSFMVKKLKDAGAIILAKANLYEFAVGTTTVSSAGGTTVNPYDLSTNPGGSSGGTGAAIAANFGVIGLGTDTGGSIRIPSSFNSLVGIRPTIGLTSRSGIVPLALTQDVGGPMTRTVADAAIALDILAGYDNKDIMTAWNVNQIPESYTDYLDPNGLRGAKIGVIIDSQVAPAAITRELYDKAKEDMERLGATVIEVNLPDIAKILSYGSLSGTEFKFQLNDYLASHESTTPYDNLQEIIDSGEYLPSLKNTLIQRNNVESLEEESYKDVLLYRTRITQQALLKVMADYNLDALMYPATAGSAGGSGGNANRIGAFSGFPSIVLPAGFTYTSDNNPRPFGIELLTRPFEEQTLIKLGYAFEQGTKYRVAPPTTPDLEVNDDAVGDDAK